MKLISRALLDELTARAAESPRARAHHTIHASAEDPVQRFLVAALPHSYFRPHRHATRSELAFILRGSFEVVTFDERGVLVARYAVGKGAADLAYETPQGTWHTLLPGAHGGVFLEIKQGPYDPATAVPRARCRSWLVLRSVARFLEWVRSARPGQAAPR